MSKPKIIRVFSAVLLPDEQRAFTHRIHPKHCHITGLLMSNKTLLSVSFQNQNALEIQQLDSMVANTLELPPAKRIITWEQTITGCSIITGSVQNKAIQAQPINIYLYCHE